MRKILLSLIISLAMILTMIPAMGSVAYADSSDKPAPAQNLSWDGNIARWDEVEGASTYQIYYKQKGTSKWKSTTTTTQSKTIKKLKKGKKYYVKVRAYKKVGTKTYYGAWSKTMLSKKIK